MSHQMSIRLLDQDTPMVDQFRKIAKELGLSMPSITCLHPLHKRYHSMKDKNPNQFWCCECLTLVKMK